MQADLRRGISVPDAGGRPAGSTQPSPGRGGRGPALPADPRHAEPAHHRRHLPLGRRDARSPRSRPTRSSTSSATPASGRGRRSCRGNCCISSAFPRVRARIELVEPTARRTIGYGHGRPRPALAAGAQSVGDADPRRHRRADRAPACADEAFGDGGDRISLSIVRERSIGTVAVPRAHDDDDGRSEHRARRREFADERPGALGCRRSAGPDRRRAARAGRDAAHPARSAGALRLYRRCRDPADRGGAQRLEGRNARRHQLLPRFSPRAGRRRGAENLPRGILPGAGLRGSGRASEARARRRRSTAPRAGRCTSRPSIASAIARSRRRRCSTASRSARLDRARLDAIVAKREGAPAMTARVFIPADSAALARRRRRGRAPRSRPRRAGAGSISRSCAPVRAASSGWSRWSKSKTPKGGVGYGPVDAGGRRRPVRRGLPRRRRASDKRSAASRSIPYLKRQQRLVFARCGVIDPLSLEDYRRHGGLKGLARAIALGPKATSTKSSPRACAGAAARAFRPAIKWRTVARRRGRPEICRLQRRRGRQRHLRRPHADGRRPVPADRGHGDRRLRGRRDAGLCLHPLGISARFPTPSRRDREGARRRFARRRRARLGHGFDLEARLGAGAYICGEETSLLESLEGKRGQVRPSRRSRRSQGLFGKPTVINNVLSFASTPWILADGGKAYAEYGVGRSRGTQPFQLAGNVKRGGLVELAFGATIRAARRGFRRRHALGAADPRRAGRRPAGRLFPANSLLDTPLDYEAMLAAKGMLGHGGIVVFDDTRRSGARRRASRSNSAPRRAAASARPAASARRAASRRSTRSSPAATGAGNIALLRDLCETLTDGSLCALGGLTPLPVLSALDHFREDFAPRRPRVAAE